jgi:uncharacterized membrane protein YfbV (UPF0208 family)
MLKDGQEYMKTWPVKKELYTLFPECRIVSATRFAIKFMPPAAVLACAGLLNTFGQDYLPQALTIGAFFLSLPMQGLLWLGHRSNQSLPPQLRTWYMDIHAKMRAQGCAVQALVSRPKYRELAGLLKTAFEDLDKVFTAKLF